MPVIAKIYAHEILDSRGRPTVLAVCELGSGVSGIASVPSGASVGRAEALELRDGDPQRYQGRGCLRAVHNVRTTIHEALCGKAYASQDELDNALIALDGSPNKSKLGANAILSVSLAFARACSNELGIPLYQYFAQSANRVADTLPRPMINLFSGGKHAGGQTAMQDVLVVPTSATTMDRILVETHAIYQSAVELIGRKYQMRALTADEGGLAPAFASDEAMLSDAIEAIEQSGLGRRSMVSLALDVASSHFYQGERYHMGQEALTGMEMIARIAGWVTTYPLISIEDGLAEDDWRHWAVLRERLSGLALTLGDDLLCTNPARIQRAVDERAADALLLKVNQIGTLTEALHSVELARNAGWQIVVSARSGETEDNWLSDLAVGWGGDYIKIGSITQSERLSKYNRLLVIEQETGWSLKR
jgi:enolase